VQRLDVTSQVGLRLEADCVGLCRRRGLGGGGAELARERHVSGMLASVSDEVRRLAERALTLTTHVRLLAFTQHKHRCVKKRSNNDFKTLK